MPTWNPALWNPVSDDVDWVLGGLVAGWTGAFYYRFFKGNKLLQLWGSVVPPVTIPIAGEAVFAYVPPFPAMTVSRWKPVWGINPGTLPSVAFIQVDPNGTLWLMASTDTQITGTQIDAIVSVDL